MVAQSKSLYVPFRALGLVCDGLENSSCSPVIYKRGLQVTITTPVDGARALHTYNLNLKLRSVSKPVPPTWLREDNRICNVAVYEDFTFAAFGSDIVLYRRMRPYCCWQVHEKPISHMLVVGNVLVTASASERRVIAFVLPQNYKDSPPKEPTPCSDIELPEGFELSAWCHPPTYINKILLGAQDGRCLLVNLRKQSIVHEFTSFGPAVTVLTPTPALDVVAVGMSDGRVVLHNFKFDEAVACYEHGAGDELENEEGQLQGNLTPIRAITFRTDGCQEMVVSDRSGNLVCWDLNERRMISAALRVHRGGAALAQFLDEEPILVTAGRSDNSIKVHIFNGEVGEARLLRCREGHKLPPTKVRFCGRSSNMLVSVGLDRELRLVSTVLDSKNKTFSQASLSSISKARRKRIRASRGVEVGAKDSSITGLLPVVTSIATSTSKLRFDDFANILTAHANREEVYTWQSKNARTFQHVLAPKRRPGKLKLAFDAMKEGKKKQKKNVRSKKQIDAENRIATCVTISPCGNFGIVGSMDGRVHIYNLQSGNHVGAFEEPNDDTERKRDTEVWGFAHNGPIAEVAVDGLSDTLLTAGTQDKKIKYWKLRTRERESGEITTEADITQLVLCQRSDLIAVACVDFGIYIYDGQSRKLARALHGHQAPITDISFAESDGRRLVSASMDGTLRTWDLVSGLCVDVLHCSEAPTSIVVAPRGAFIATTHVNNLAVVLWVDQSRYVSIDEIKKAESGTDIPELDLPVLENVVREDDEASDTDVDMDGDDEEIPKLDLELKQDCLAPSLVTFSGKPAAQWTVLSNLSAIRERNKPLAPPKKPENAPFFLPTVKGLEFKFDVQANSKNEEEAEELESKIKKMENEDSDDEGLLGNSEFGKLVRDEQFEEATKLLHSLQPSGVDVELRTLEGKKSICSAVEYFLKRLEDNMSFELTQAHLDVFLKAHGMELAQFDVGAELLSSLLVAQEEAWQDLRQRIDAVVALSSHFSGQV